SSCARTDPRVLWSTPGPCTSDPRWPCPSARRSCCDSTPPSTTRSHGGRGRSCAVPTPRSSSSCVRPCRKQGGCPRRPGTSPGGADRSEEHTSELQSRFDLVCRLLL